MTELPEPIGAYFAADRFDGDAIARCFTKDAVVNDEGRIYTGRESIKAWKSAVAAKFRYTSEPIASRQEDGMMVVTSRLTGDFPGSPVKLRYFFRLERGKIAFLEIVP